MRGKKIAGLIVLAGIPLWANIARADEIDYDITATGLTTTVTSDGSGGNIVDYQGTDNTIAVSEDGGPPIDYPSIAYPATFFDLNFDVNSLGFITDYNLKTTFAGQTSTTSYTAPPLTPLSVFPFGPVAHPLQNIEFYLPGLGDGVDFASYAYVHSNSGDDALDAGSDPTVDINFSAATPLPKSSYGAGAMLAGMFGLSVIRRRKASLQQVKELA